MGLALTNGVSAKGAQRWVDIFGQSFQPSEFLKPLESVLSSPASNMEAKHLVIHIVQTMIKARYKNIKSGWKTVWFHCFWEVIHESG